MPSDALLFQGLALGVLSGGVYALMASGLSLSFGVMRVVHLSHASFVVLGAYLAYLGHTSAGLHPLVTMLLVAPVFYVAGKLLYRHLLGRPAAANPAMTVLATVGVALVIEGLIGATATGVYRTIDFGWAHESVTAFGAELPRGRLVASGVAVVTLGVLGVVLHTTRFGRALRASIQHREAARLVGIDVEPVAAAGFGLALATTAIGGACLLLITTFHPAMHWEWLARLLAIVVVGGLGSVAGAGLAALGMGVVEGLLAVSIDPTWAAMAFYLSLFVALVIRPHGILGERVGARSA